MCDYVERVDCNGVPVLPVEETTDEFDYQGEMENSSNEDYYGGFGSQGNKPYGKKKIDDEDDSQSTLIKNIS